MTKLKSNLSIISLLILLSIISACGDSGVTVTSTFAEQHSIEKGAPVFLEENEVGSVVSVNQLDTGTQVKINFDAENAKSISSKAAVLINTMREGAPLQIYNRSASDESIVQDGQEIKALDSMFQLGAWMVGDAIQLGGSTVTDYVESFQDYLKSEKFEDDKTIMQEQIQEATAAAQEALISVEQDFTSAMSELTKSEEDAAQAMQDLGVELAPLVEELSKNGSELAEQLEEFSKNLQESAQDKEGGAKSGQKLIEGLIAMLEELNQGIEQGLQEAENTTAP